MANNLIYQSRPKEGAHGSSKRSQWRGIPLGLRQYIDCLTRTVIPVEASQSGAFWWEGAQLPPEGMDIRLLKLLGQSNNGRGIAAACHSALGADGEVATLVQFQCLGELPSETHLRIVGCVTSYVHLNLVSRAQVVAHEGAPESALTAKEREVFRWVAEGKTSWDVGQIMAVSERTIKFHLGNIYTKLQVSNRAQAVMVANRMRLI